MRPAKATSTSLTISSDTHVSALRLTSGAGSIRRNQNNPWASARVSCRRNTVAGTSEGGEGTLLERLGKEMLADQKIFKPVDTFADSVAGRARLDGPGSNRRGKETLADRSIFWPSGTLVNQSFRSDEKRSRPASQTFRSAHKLSSRPEFQSF